MWLLVFMFLAVTLALCWMLFGYFIFMYVAGTFRDHPAPREPEEWPMVSMMVPCYNEQEGIIAKLEDISALDYPKDRLEAVFIDGGSTDGTCSLLEKALEGRENFSLVKAPEKGKINQLNHVLPSLKGSIIVNTDVDARLSSDALKKLMTEFSDPNVYVAGAFCSPSETLDVEDYYWSAQNKGRLIETRAESSSIVIAQCYAFRKQLLASIPDDVVADDIYVAFLAGTKGWKTVYSSTALAVETRTPKTYAEFMPHKFRKSNAFLRESLRFIYKMPEMSPFFKLTFVTRLFQQLFLPWTLLAWLLTAGVLLTLFRFDIVIFGTLFLFANFVATSFVFSKVRLPDRDHQYSLFTVIKGYILTNIIMISTALSYPYYSQNSSYSRLGRESK